MQFGTQKDMLEFFFMISVCVPFFNAVLKNNQKLFQFLGVLWDLTDLYEQKNCKVPKQIPLKTPSSKKNNQQFSFKHAIKHQIILSFFKWTLDH